MTPDCCARKARSCAKRWDGSRFPRRSRRKSATTWELSRQAGLLPCGPPRRWKTWRAPRLPVSTRPISTVPVPTDSGENQGLLSVAVVRPRDRVPASTGLRSCAGRDGSRRAADGPVRGRWRRLQHQSGQRRSRRDGCRCQFRSWANPSSAAKARWTTLHRPRHARGPLGEHRAEEPEGRRRRRRHQRKSSLSQEEGARPA